MLDFIRPTVQSVAQISFGNQAERSEQNNWIEALVNVIIWSVSRNMRFSN